MRPHKNFVLRIILGLAAIGCGLLVQVVGALIDKKIYIEILPGYGIVALFTTLLGFVLMGVFIYKWAIK
jgi:hypothetical protein